jgi:hypothetical protein
MRPYLAVLLCVLQIPAVFAAHGCSLFKGDCNGRTSDAVLCPIALRRDICYRYKTQSTCPCDWESGKCTLNHADQVTYDNAYYEVYGAASKYKQNITCPSSVNDCGAECEIISGTTYCEPKMSIIQAKLEADAYQRAAIHVGYSFYAFDKKTCAMLNEATCKATDKSCQYVVNPSAANSCESSDAHDLATAANVCPDTDFTALAALMNTTMSEAYQKTGVTPENNFVTSAACDNPVNLLFFTVLAVSVSFAARF